MRRPNFFIVGAPKCGTSALFAYLNQHPQVFMAHLKELHFFGTDVRYPARPTLDQYLLHFAKAREELRVGEASTSYLFSQSAAQEIRAFNPAARIVIMLRNPVDMMYSLHSEMLYWLNEDIEDFEAALEAEEKRKVVENITERIVIGKDDVTINLCYLPSSSEIMAEKQRGLTDSSPRQA